MIHELYFPLVKLAGKHDLDSQGREALDFIVKLALDMGRMDSYMIVNFLAGLMGMEPSRAQEIFLSPSGAPSKALQEAQSYALNRKMNNFGIGVPGSEGGTVPKVYELLERYNAVYYLPYIGIPLGLYKAAYGGASAGLANWRSSMDSKDVPGIRGASPDDIVQAMIFGGVPLPGEKWDNVSNTYKKREPLFPAGENIMTRLGPGKPTISRLKGSLSTAAERTALKWVMSIDKGYKGGFLGNEAIPEVYKEIEPLSPEELIEFDGWFDLVIPRARFNLKSAPAQLEILETIIKMRDKGRDPLIYKGGANPEVGLKIGEVQKWMESEGKEPPSAPRIAKVWTRVRDAIMAGFYEAFAVVQQGLLDQMKEEETRLLTKHMSDGDIRETMKSKRTQIMEDFIDQQTRYSRRASLDKTALKVRELHYLMKAGKQFGILSAYGPFSKSVNQALNGDLVGDLMSRGYKFHPLKGSWEGVSEKSVLVPNMKFSDLVEMGRKFNQESVIYKDPSGVIGMYFLKEGTVTFAVDEEGSAAVQIAVGDSLYSKSRGVSFEFGFAWGHKQPWNGSSPYTVKGLTRALAQQA